MTQCNVIAIDLAKDIFQVCIMTPNGKITFNKAMSRAKLKEWLVKKNALLLRWKVVAELITGQGLLNL